MCPDCPLASTFAVCRSHTKCLPQCSPRADCDVSLACPRNRHASHRFQASFHSLSARALSRFSASAAALVACELGDTSRIISGGSSAGPPLMRAARADLAPRCRAACASRALGSIGNYFHALTAELALLRLSGQRGRDPGLHGVASALFGNGPGGALHIKAGDADRRRTARQTKPAVSARSNSW